MLVPGKRGGLWRYHWGTVGVSATTGAYHYLDIPGCLDADGLSPDGRHVSCFTDGGTGDHQVLRGLEVYDTVTGRLDRWTPTQGRLRLNSVAWVGNDALSLRAGGTSYLWRFGYGAPTAIRTRLGPTVGTGPDTGLYAAGPDGYRYLQARGAHRVVHVRLATRSLDATRTPAAVSPSGDQIALVHPDDSGGQLLVGDISPSGGRTSVVPVAASLQWPRVIGWADEQHVLVLDQVTPTGRDGSGDVDSRYALERVDVDTGTVERVSNAMNQQDSSASFASSLLGVPPRDFPAPPSPLNRRVEAWLALGVLLLGACSLASWRRRVRL
jgi:hypothetical protein